MLANPQQHHPTSAYPLGQHHFHELQSPLSSAHVPFYFGDSFATSTPSPSDLDHPRSQKALSSQASSSQTHTASGFFENLPLMSTSLYSSASPASTTQTPPIRIYQSSPTPQLSETALSRHEWQSNGHRGSMFSDHAQLSRRGNMNKHQRTSSGSSVGSGGPSSPYQASTSHPQIANIESSPSGLQAYPAYDFADQADGLPYMKSSQDSQESFLAPAFQNYNPSTQDSESNVAAKLAMMRALKAQHRDDSPAPTFSASSRGHPSPRTPRTIYEGETPEAMANGTHNMDTVYNPWSDEYLRELLGFNSGMPLINSNQDTFTEDMYAAAALSNPSMTARKSSQMGGSMLSPYRNMIQATSNGQFQQMGSQSPASTTSRERSPYRPQGSPFPMSYSTQPKTVSPKDVTLEFSEPEVDYKTPLFPSEDSMDTDMQDYDDMSMRRQSSNFAYTPTSMPSNVQIPQQYPFIAQVRRQNSSFQSQGSATPEFPAHLTSMESSVSEGGSLEIPKPANATADSGIYTCTYHGCTLRFESPSKLQKHKREGHRQQTPSATTGISSAALLRNSQAGPHKCERINPQTNKPCNTIFSRPYDLTRHEDTIHNGRKQKVRCQYCSEEKTFSRNDALTRHMRVVHPEVDFPGKIRKRHE